MPHKTQHHKIKRRNYRFKTQRGGFLAELVPRVGRILTGLLRRLPGTVAEPVGARVAAVTVPQAQELIGTAVGNVVQQVVTNVPELAGRAATLTADIIRVSEDKIAILATAAAAGAGSALTTSVIPALGALSAGITTGLLRGVADIARTSEGRDALRRIVERAVEYAFRREAATPVVPAAGNPFEGVLRGAADAARAGLPRRGLPPRLPGVVRPQGLPGLRRYAEAAVRHGARGFAAQAARAPGNAAEYARAGAQVDAEATAVLQEATRSRTIFTDEQIDDMNRTQLLRAVKDWGYTPARGEQGLQAKLKELMQAARAEQVARFGIGQPPPARAMNVAALARAAGEGAPRAAEGVAQGVVALPGRFQNTTPTQILANAAKDTVVGVEARENIDRSLTDSKEKVSNMFDTGFFPSPIFIRMLTDISFLRDMFRGTSPLAENGSEFLRSILDSTYGAVQAIQFNRNNVNYYRLLGDRVIDNNPEYVRLYNNQVEQVLRFILERSPRAQIRQLVNVLQAPMMRDFKRGMFDLFLNSPLTALQVLNSVITYIIPNLDRMPLAMEQIITRLQSDPETILTLIGQLLQRLGVAAGELNNERLIAFQRGAGFAFGRYGVLALGFGGLIFFGAFLGISSISGLMWKLELELATFSFANVGNFVVNTANRFYDALHYAILGRNAEQAITNGVIVPVEAAVGGLQTWWSNFIQAGHPRTLFETMVANITTLVGNVNRTYFVVFSGAVIVGIIFVNARRDRLAAAALPGAPPIPPPAIPNLPPPPPPGAPGNGGPPPPAPGNGGPPPPLAIPARANDMPGLPPSPRNNNNAPSNNNNAPSNNNNFVFPNFPPSAGIRAARPRENFNIAGIRNAQLRAAAAVPVPGPINNA